jgi:hypothetical protein
MAGRTAGELAAALRQMAASQDDEQGGVADILREAAAILSVRSGIQHHHAGCETEGLYHKFHVSRTDGSGDPGGKHDGCWYFVLDPTHDLQARVALGIYAELARQNHREPLADDLWQRPELAYDPSYIDTRLAELATQRALARFYREANT